MRLVRNIFLRAPDFRSILTTNMPQATLYRFKDLEPQVFRLEVPIDRKALTDAMDYDITTCQLSGTITIIARRNHEPDLSFTGDGNVPELR